MFVKPEIERFAKIRVIGIGGCGCNVINTMIDSQQINGVEFIAVNTDAQDLSVNKAIVKIPIGQDKTKGLGAGADPEIGRVAAEESMEQIRSNLEGSDMVFIAAGMGGGTGTGASPIIAKIAKEVGALTIGVVTKPFRFEGAQRMENAEIGIETLKEEVDALITIPNQKLIEIADASMSILDAFKVSDSVLTQGVQGISDLIVVPGLINVDFADVRSIMKNAGSALMGIGIGTGENRAEIAAKAAISSPLLEVSIEGATGILLNIIGGVDLTMREVDKAAQIINEAASPDANIIFGTNIDMTIKDEIKIIVIATGFDTALNSQYTVHNRLDRVRQQVTEPQAQPQVQTNTQRNSSIFNPAAATSSASQPQQAQQAPHNNQVFPNRDDKADDEDKYDIPAFLRGK